MLRRSAPLCKLANTIHGQRRILKSRLPVQKYIQMAVQAGSYKSPSNRPHFLGMHDIPPTPPANGRYQTKREREEQLKMRRGIIDYPTEYEILSLNPPLPRPPKTPVKVRKQLVADKIKRQQKLKKEAQRRQLLGIEDDHRTSKMAAELPSLDRLVKSYLKRQEQNQRDMSPSQVRQEEEYYSNLLLGRNANAKTAFLSQSSVRTAMGRKSMVLENAYAFALRQQQELLNNAATANNNSNNSSNNGNNTNNHYAASGFLTEQDSVEKVEQLLRQEARKNRQVAHEVAKGIVDWREEIEEEDTASTDNGNNANGTTKDKAKATKKNDTTTTTSIPSILHSKPRTIRALSIWSSRLQSIPYSRWTIGAATALDHWIARDVLGMEEKTWLAVLEGGGADYAYTTTDDQDNWQSGSMAGIIDRMRDIVSVRGALFPETLNSDDGGGSGAGDVASHELEAHLLDDGGGNKASGNATEQSIDELLASLGGINDDDDDEDNIFKFDDDNDGKKGDGLNDEDTEESMEPFESIMDELQVWRQRNVSSPYESWDLDRKKEFDQWINKYVATLSPEADATKVDMDATRQALLSEKPIDRDESRQFWNNVRSESEAELFLQDYRAKAQEQLSSLLETKSSSHLSLTDEESALLSKLQDVLSVPYERQLRKLVNMGTLRPMLDEYTHEKDRQRFFEKYSSIFLEGLEMEHLVPDPEGPIRLDDLSSDLRDELSGEWSPSISSSGSLPAALSSSSDQEPRFAIRMIAYGTDEFGSERAGRARDLYRLWNEHKANRAKFEEAMFKKGLMGLEQTRVRSSSGKKGKGFHKK